MWFYTFIAIFGVALYKLITSKSSPARYGVYSQPGKTYWLKYWVFYILFNLRKRQNKAKANVSGGNAGYGMRSRSNISDMEKVQELPLDHPKAVDAVYFNGGSAEGYFMVAATARRHEGLVQTLLYFRVPGVGLLELASLPDTSLRSPIPTQFAAGGLQLKPDEPMKKWKIVFDGEMRLIKPSGETENMHVAFNLDWNASSKFFDFDTDLDTWAMCASMAREEWTREYFDRLKLAHQTHHEQFGEISGTVDLGKYGNHTVKIQGVRDHSYGNVRNWNDLHRYAIQYIYLTDGTCVCVGNICMKPTMSRLVIGYVFHPDGSMDTVSSTDLELPDLGENGDDPIDFQFKFQAGDHQYQLTGHVLDRPIFYMGEEWDARIHERLCEYTINNIKGWGISEWEYCYEGGKGNVWTRPSK